MLRIHHFEIELTNLFVSWTYPLLDQTIQKADSRSKTVSEEFSIKNVSLVDLQIMKF